MVSLLTLLWGCGTEAERPGIPDWDGAPVVPDVASEVAEAESRAFEMDFGGGGSGAPYGVNFFVPPGVLATPVAGILSDGSKGFSLSVPTPGEAVVCAAPVRMQGRVTVGTRLRISELAASTETWSGVDVELRARDAQKQIVAPGASRFVVIQQYRAPVDWVEWQTEVEVPPLAVMGEVCYRFVKATGSLEVDRLVVQSPGVPVPTPVPIVAVDWPLNEAGGAGGAPVGFGFLLPPGTGGAALDVFREPQTAPVNSEPNETGVVRGIRMRVDQPGNALVCSDAISVAPGMQVRGRVRVNALSTDTRDWTGFVLEMRAYDMVGALASAGPTPFTLLRAWKAPEDWMEFSLPFAPPKSATSGKVCFRFVESTGEADIDWVAVGE